MNFGDVTKLELCLSPAVAVVQSKYSDEIFYALNFFLWNETILETLPMPRVREDTRLTAVVEIGNVTYTLEGIGVDGQLELLAHPKLEPYLDIVSHCPEEDDLCVYCRRRHILSNRLQSYLDPESDLQKREQFYASKGYTETRIFREYVYSYIESFLPRPLCRGKPYLFELDKEGTFFVSLHGEKLEHLSENEKTLFSYFCFFYTADFWAKLERIRNMHHKKKPLLIKDFAEFLDESTDTKEIIEEAENLNRQVIFTQNGKDGKHG